MSHSPSEAADGGDGAEYSSSRSRAALEALLARPPAAAALADLFGAEELAAAKGSADEGADAAEHADDGADADGADLSARRRALLEATSRLVDPASIGRDEGTNEAAASAAESAALYNDLQAYLERLQRRTDLIELPEELRSNEGLVAGAEQPAGDRDATGNLPDWIHDGTADAAAAPSATAAAVPASAAVSGSSSTPARRPYHFAPPFSPPNGQVMRSSPTPPPPSAAPGSGGARSGSRARNHSAAASSSAAESESKELLPTAAAAATSGRTSRAAAASPAITPLSPTAKGLSSPSRASSRPASVFTEHKSPSSDLPSSSATTGAPTGSGARPDTAASSSSAVADPLDIGLEEGEEAFDPAAPFDEQEQMDKIAQLDELLAEAEGRSAAMDRRLQELMAQPLPSLDPLLIAAAEDGDVAALLLMPGSPSAANTAANGDLSSPTAAASDEGFFMTSVPGSVPIFLLVRGAFTRVHGLAR